MYIIKEEISCGCSDPRKKIYIDNGQKAELETWLIDSGFEKRDDGSFTRDLPNYYLKQIFLFEESEDFQDKKIRKIKDIKRDLRMCN